MKLIQSKNIVQVKLKGGEEIHIKPLTIADKQAIIQAGEVEMSKAAIECLQRSIKDLRGFMIDEETPYVPSRDANGMIDMECIEILNNNLGHVLPDLVSALMGSSLGHDLASKGYEYKVTSGN